MTTTNTNQKDQMPIIRCECGAEILLIPDLSEMSQTIEMHLQQHKTAEANHIESILLTQVIDLIIQNNKPAKQD
jgi:hypothetical protein